MALKKEEMMLRLVQTLKIPGLPWGKSETPLISCWFYIDFRQENKKKRDLLIRLMRGWWGKMNLWFNQGQCLDDFYIYISSRIVCFIICLWLLLIVLFCWCNGNEMVHHLVSPCLIARNNYLLCDLSFRFGGDWGEVNEGHSRWKVCSSLSNKHDASRPYFRIFNSEFLVFHFAAKNIHIANKFILHTRGVTIN